MSFAQHQNVEEPPCGTIRQSSLARGSTTHGTNESEEPCKQESFPLSNFSYASKFPLMPIIGLKGLIVHVSVIARSRRRSGDSSSG
jgi:hypothetical protein